MSSQFQKFATALLLLGLTVANGTRGSTLRVPTQYKTIQKAVDAAQTNDIIQIAAGVYTEQVIIVSNKLSIIGQPGTILRATGQMQPWVPDIGIPASLQGHHVPIVAVLLSDVSVRGITFEGERLAANFTNPDLGDLGGVFFLRSSGSVENCAFHGFREETPGIDGATPVWFSTFADDDVVARVVGCTFTDSYGGIFMKGGPERQNITATIEDNTIVGLGTLQIEPEYCGIEILQGVGGRIAHNRISGFSFVGAREAGYPFGYGILAVNLVAFPDFFGVLQPLQIEGNELRDNQIHVALINGDGSALRHNRVSGTAPGVLPVGFLVSGIGVEISENQFEELPEGIRLLGGGEDYGSILGVAVEAVVSSNRFCHVARTVKVEADATVQQRGALLCPFPSPALAITPAVLVSWPEEEVGWTLESAPAPEGPWAPSTATRFVQEGKQQIAVPTTDAARFFRLR